MSAEKTTASVFAIIVGSIAMIFIEIWGMAAFSDWYWSRPSYLYSQCIQTATHYANLKDLDNCEIVRERLDTPANPDGER